MEKIKLGGGKRRKPKSLPMLTPEELLILINKKCKSLRDKAFLSMMWLTACRVGEVVQYSRSFKENGKWKKYNIAEGIKKFQVRPEQLEDKWYLVIENVRVLKKRHPDFKTIAIPEREKEIPFINYIVEYMGTLPNDDDILFNFSRQRGYQIIRQVTGLFPHFFRTARLTFLCNEYNLDAADLKEWVQWSSIGNADAYLRTSWKRMSRKFWNS